MWVHGAAVLHFNDCPKSLHCLEVAAMPYYLCVTRKYLVYLPDIFLMVFLYNLRHIRSLHTEGPVRNAEGRGEVDLRACDALSILG